LIKFFEIRVEDTEEEMRENVGKNIFPEFERA